MKDYSTKSIVFYYNDCTVYVWVDDKLYWIEGKGEIAT